MKDGSASATAITSLPHLSSEKAYENRLKEILFFRHKLQKALVVSNGDDIRTEDVYVANGYLERLENFGRMEPSIIQLTKIHRVMKHVVCKTNHARIPCESEFRIVDRCRALWDLYRQILAENADADADNAGVGADKTGIAEALDKRLTIGDRVTEPSLNAGARTSTQRTSSAVVGRSSGDMWVWVGRGDQDLVSGQIGSITRHPGWDNDTVVPPPECASPIDIGEEMYIGTSGELD